MKTLKMLRVQHGFLQSELALQFDVVIPLVGKLERGQVNFSPKMRRKYMKQFKLSPQELEDIWQETKRYQKEKLENSEPVAVTDQNEKTTV
jgi:DNA-binding XRE family transcriptional regulator